MKEKNPSPTRRGICDTGCYSWIFDVFQFVACRTLDTYTHVKGDMQERASGIVGNFVEDIFGKGLNCYG